jgi:subtilisin family serine protease
MQVQAADTSPGNDKAARKARPDRLIFKPKPGITPEQLQHLQGNRRLLKRFERLGKISVVQLDAGETLNQAIDRLNASGLVEFAEPDYLLQAAVVPNDPHFASGLQWSLRNSTPGKDINAPAAWDILNSAPDVVVAVVDTGIRYTHEDLAANMWRNPSEVPNNNVDDDGNGIIDDVHGINAITGSGNPMDDGDHGTHVAGIIGAVGNNGKGITGVAWNVKLMACKFIASDGFGFTSDAVDAIDYAIDHGAHVINASFGGGGYSSALFAAIQRARAAGIIFVAAAGNEQLNIDSFPTYPASYSLDNIVVVGATTRTDAFDASYSNFGANGVDLFAPGSSIYSTWGSGDNAYRSETGTSMAAPHVAGAAALMRARYTNLTSSEIINRLMASVDVLPGLSGKCRTGGRLNLSKALGPDPWANFRASKWTGEPPLKVNFTNLSLGQITSYNWDFGDDTPDSSAVHPTHTYSTAGEYNVRLTVVGANGQTDTMTRQIRVVANYEFSAEPYLWVSTSGMTRLTLTDNGVSGALAIPFEVEFYNVKHNQIYVGANGIMGFSPAGLGNRDNVSMPNGNAPNNFIAPFWDDLDPTTAIVSVGTVGVAPNRRYVASWENVRRIANNTRQHFQVILEENGGGIVFQYKQIEGGRSATVGIENGEGNAAAMHLFNGSPTLLANNTAYRIGRKFFRFLSVDRTTLSFDVNQGVASPSTFLLRNEGNADMNWSVNSPSSWISATAPSGTLTPNGTTEVQLQLTAEALALSPGLYETTVNVANLSDGIGNVSIPVNIQIQPPPGRLDFSPAISDLFTGAFGGPFEPASVTVQLNNSGGTALDWTSASDSTWVNVNPLRGRLDPGEGITVHLAISSNSLPAGTHTASVEFQNVSAEGSPRFNQSIRLLVNGLLETASASIQDGKLRAAIPAPQAGAYAVEFTIDFESWDELTTAIAVNGAVEFTDAVPVTSQSHRFYRLRKL